MKRGLAVKDNYLDSKKQIKTGALLSYGSIAVTFLVGMFFTPWMISAIGKSQYGLYTLANSIISLCVIDFGLGSAISRYVAKYHAEHDEQAVNNLLGAIYKIYGIVSFFILLALTVWFFFIDIIYIRLTPNELHDFKVVYVIAASYAVVSFPFVSLNGILTAYEKFAQLKIADLIYRILFVLFNYIALSKGLGLYALVVCNVLAGMIAILYRLYAVFHGTSIKINFKYWSRDLFKDIFVFSFWVTVNTLAARLIFNITPTILGALSETKEIAVFGIVTQLEGYIYTVSTAINGMFIPKISRIYSGTDKDSEILPLMINVGRYQYSINALLIVGFTLIGKSFIRLWLGNDYEDAYLGVLLVTVPGVFFNSLQIGNSALVVQKKVRSQALIGIVTGLLNVILSLFLTKKYGCIGSCISIFIAYSIRSVLTVIACQRILKINVWSFVVNCFAKMSIPAIFTILVGFFALQYININGWEGIAIKAMCILCMYCLFLYLFGINKDEKKTIINWIQ